jgi:hypothetical protein
MIWGMRIKLYYKRQTKKKIYESKFLINKISMDEIEKQSFNKKESKTKQNK